MQLTPVIHVSISAWCAFSEQVNYPCNLRLRHGFKACNPTIIIYISNQISWYLPLISVGQKTTIEESVKAVLDCVMQPVYQGRDPQTVNANMLEQHGRSLPHRLAVAKMMYLLDPTTEVKAISMATDLSDDLQGRNVKVRIWSRNLSGKSFGGRLAKLYVFQNCPNRFSRCRTV